MLQDGPRPVKLSDARLCMDCETVFKDQHGTCPACGRGQSFPIAKWLDREERVSAAVIAYLLLSEMERVI